MFQANVDLVDESFDVFVETPARLYLSAVFKSFCLVILIILLPKPLKYLSKCHNRDFLKNSDWNSCRVVVVIRAENLFISAVFLLHVSQNATYKMSQAAVDSNCPRGITSPSPSHGPGSAGMSRYGWSVYCGQRLTGTHR